ncbi:MAG: ABC transporter substrate-binding protein [Myxococcota bacterium]|nr:ABC transporter substrate-binding protein [Myxococcota bacterium]
MRTELKAAAVIAIIGIFGAFSCAKKAPLLVPDSAASDDPQVEKAFRKARDAFEAGRLPAADRSFLRIIEQYPRDPLARVCVIYRARIALANEKPQQARALLRPLLGASDLVGERASFYDGIALFEMGEKKQAIERLIPFIGRLTDPDENRRLLDTLWRASLDTGNVLHAVIWLDQYLASTAPGKARDDAATSLADIIAKIDDVDALEKLRDRLTQGDAAWSQVMARLAQRLFELGRGDEAKRVLEKADDKGQEDDSLAAASMPSQEPRETTTVLTIGCIVPISGRSRLIGETVLKGVMLGVKAIDVGPGIELSIKMEDSKGLPEQAAQAVDKLIYEEGALAIVGPVDGAAAQAAAARAEVLRVPMMALSIREDITADKQYIFREFATNRSEARALVEVMRQIGLEQMAVLHPDTGYGRAMRDLVADELSLEDLDLSGELRYDPKTTSFVEAVAPLPDMAFDALFIPDAAQRIALLAPAIAAAGIWPTAPETEPTGPGRPVQLLIPSTGFSPELIRREGRYLQGAMFATFLSAEASAGSADFINRFRLAYGGDPSYLAGFGHDAVVLIASAIRDGAGDQEAIRDWLANTKGTNLSTLPLATPFAGFSKEGEPLALPWILKLQESQFTLVEYSGP